MLPLLLAGHVCEQLCKPFGITPPIFPRRVDWYRQNRAFDIRKAKRDLGYRPLVGLTEGLARTANWYRTEGYLPHARGSDGERAVSEGRVSMVAIYGVVGDAGRAELEAMAARLAHRGAFGAHWSPGPGVWFGMQARSHAELATDGPLLLDGRLDNRWQLATAPRRRRAARAGSRQATRRC